MSFCLGEAYSVLGMKCHDISHFQMAQQKSVHVYMYSRCVHMFIEREKNEAKCYNAGS